MTIIPKGETHSWAFAKFGEEDGDRLVVSEDLVVLTKEEHDSLRRIAQSAQDMSDMLKAANISVDGMTFGQAIDACRYRGAKIQRKNWNGKNQYVEFRHVATLLEDEADAIIDEGNERDYFAFVFYFVNRNTGEPDIQVGWLASQADMAANDWVIVE